MSIAEIDEVGSKSVVMRLPPRAFYAVTTAVMASAIVLGFAASISDWTIGAFIAFPLVLITALWISGGAATSLLGLFSPTPRAEPLPDGWQPSASTAILVTVCGEDPAPLARYLASLRAGLDRAGLGEKTRIFVLSDTSGASRIAPEQAVFEPLSDDGRICYRRRPLNTGRKPGNISDWLWSHGDRYGYMMVLDADSRMSADRIRTMIWQIERRPRIGLLQAGIGLVPAKTRFGRHQRVASRVLSHNFGRGFAAWTGDSGNYWGHNAIMRTAAFRSAAQLPRLSGAAPFGGDVLSHDFIEAAWIRRAGWAVVLDPQTGGSSEDAPPTLGAFHRRDRRWCQGNLQHLRLLAAPGLSGVSRIHLVAGIVSYLVAPIWLILVALIASGAVNISGAGALLLVLGVLLVPKLSALADWWVRAHTFRRRLVGLRALGSELFVSSVIAPLIMVRNAGAVASVLLGRDCGWKSARSPRLTVPDGLAEMVVGAGLLAIAWMATGTATLWLLPVVAPLCAAPLIVRALNAPA